MNRAERCTHEGMLELRIKPRGRMNAERLVQWQCSGCFAGYGTPVPASKVSPTWPALRPWRKPRPTRNSRGRAYEAFLQSAAWKKIRTEILVRDNFTCQECGEPGSQVHHLNYDRFGGKERPEDLSTICEYCHREHGQGA